LEKFEEIFEIEKFSKTDEFMKNGKGFKD